MEAAVCEHGIAPEPRGWVSPGRPERNDGGATSWGSAPLYLVHAMTNVQNLTDTTFELRTSLAVAGRTRHSGVGVGVGGQPHGDSPRACRAGFHSRRRRCSWAA